MTTKAETLTFNYRPGDTVTRPRVEQETFATTEEHVEPRDWGYFGLMLFTAVLLLRPQDKVPALEKLHVAEICALLGIGPMLLHRLARRMPTFRITPETTGLLLLGVAIIGTAPFSIWPGGAIEVFTDNYLKIMIVFVLMMNTLTTTKRLERLTWLILLCIGYIAFLSVSNYARGVNLVEGGRLAGPVSGIFGNPNDLALNMVTFMPLAMVVAMSPRNSMTKRGTAALIAAMMLATIVFTKSRGGMLGAVTAIAALSLMGGAVRRGFGTMTVIAVLVAVPFMPSSFWDRMSSIVDEQQDAKEFTGSREARQNVMGDAVEIFIDNPITGVGAGQFKNYNPPERKEKWLETHNVLLQVATETGIVGLLAFCFLVMRAFTAAFRTRKTVRDRSWLSMMTRSNREDDARSLGEHTLGMTAGLAGWFVCALFASVAYNWTFYYVLALLVAARELTFDSARVAVPAKLKKISV
ncbi:MAG TPA: O-antigen ligase family protein [Vicinamibacterales bacterium]|nr:O-antigen ligase family protein [Vicinamibacterales bacterium]